MKKEMTLIEGSTMIKLDDAIKLCTEDVKT